MAELPGIGVFGTGYVNRHLISILKEEGFEVEALWGKNLADVQRIGKDLSINFTTTKVDELLLHKNVDLICIHSAPHVQSPVAVKALGIGKHVICGLPCGPRPHDTLKMVKAAEYYPALMAIILNCHRFLPCFSKMREMLQSGYIGGLNVCEITVRCGSQVGETYEWVCDERMGGGILNFYGSMVIDLITYLLNQRIVKVNGVSRTFNRQTKHIKGIREIDSDDFCSFQMELSGGAHAVVTINSHVPGDFSQEVLICGSGGYLRVQDTDLFAKQGEAFVEEVIRSENVDDVLRSLDEKPESVSAACRGMKQFVKTLKNAFMAVDERHGYDKNLIQNAENFVDALYVQNVIEAVKLSSRTHVWTQVETDCEGKHEVNGLKSSLKPTTASILL